MWRESSGPVSGKTVQLCEHSFVTDKGPDRDRGWTVMFGPGPVAATRAEFAQWREANGLVPDDDIRLDLIRTTAGDHLRVLVRQ